MIGFRTTKLSSEQHLTPFTIPVGTVLINTSCMSPWGVSPQIVTGHTFVAQKAWCSDTERAEVCVYHPQRTDPDTGYTAVKINLALPDEFLMQGDYCVITQMVKVRSVKLDGTLRKEVPTTTYRKRILRGSLEDYLEARRKRIEEIADLSSKEQIAAHDFIRSVRYLFTMFFPMNPMENMNLMYVWERIKWKKTYKRLENLKTDLQVDLFPHGYWQLKGPVPEKEEEHEKKQELFKLVMKTTSLKPIEKLGVIPTRKMRHIIRLRRVQNRRHKRMMSYAEEYAKELWNALSESAAEFVSQYDEKKHYALYRIIGRTLRTEWHGVHGIWYGGYK